MEIKTWVERCNDHPDHQTGMVSEGMIRARMEEEIEDLRAEVERLRTEKYLLREIDRLVAMTEQRPAPASWGATNLQIANDFLAREIALALESLRAFETANRQLQAALDTATRERDEALEEIRCLGLSEALAKHSGSPSREWHSVGAWLYPGETINHVIRSPREELEAKP